MSESESGWSIVPSSSIKRNLPRSIATGKETPVPLNWQCFVILRIKVVFFCCPLPYLLQKRKEKKRKEKKRKEKKKRDKWIRYLGVVVECCGEGRCTSFPYVTKIKINSLAAFLLFFFPPLPLFFFFPPPFLFRIFPK
jgi:hypothetical protein